MSPTIVVWVLYIFVGAPRGGGPAIVDNIASQQNCEALLNQMRRDWNNDDPSYPHYTFGGRCLAVRKVAQ